MLITDSHAYSEKTIRTIRNNKRAVQKTSKYETLSKTKLQINDTKTIHSLPFIFMRKYKIKKKCSTNMQGTYRLFIIRLFSRNITLR